MMANKGGTPENLKPPFSKTNQPKNRGRRPSRLKKYIEDNKLSSADIGAAAKYLLPKSQTDLEIVLQDKSIPMLIRLFARAMVKDLKEGNLTNLDKMLDRAIGKPKAQVDIKAQYDIMTMDVKLTPEEEAAAEKRLAAFLGENMGE
jgi:hypothetical protein